MKKSGKPILAILLAILIVIQFFHPKKNTAPAGNLANDIGTVYHVPAGVKNILQASCYDCHSNNTVYPWYAKIQPVAWWLDNHIRDGKDAVNFSEFGTYRVRKQYKKLEEITEQVKDNEMPLSSYTLIHRYAMLSAGQKQQLTDWANATRDTIKSRFAPDSLLKK